MLVSWMLVPAIGLLLASNVGPKPPVKFHCPPALFGFRSSIFTPRTRPPNLNVCFPFCICVKLYNSQREFSLIAWPTCEQTAEGERQPLKELLTFKTGIVLLPRDWLRLREY